MNRKGIIIVVSGFSGAGKGTIMKALTAKYDQYALSISATTRDPRPGEVNGREYFFVSNEEFEKLIADNGLIEHAGYVNHYYGTPRKFVEDKLNAGIDVILEIEIQGALQVKEQYPDAVLLFVMPPSAAELEKRLRGRGTESDEVIRQRLKRAVEESVGIENYDYIVINDKLEDAVESVHGIITAAHGTPDRNMEFISKVREELNGLN
ncbi:guanylate kinase Gmk2 [Butyrivibrio proteoclasticus B316]|uniref:Guanylate kinase n=1 Tax=Butyrivibrio proteoclasticus (strain ATCC 51982 / DSM 14932 / B316) TaxID=515622 RepID=E0S2Q3_BUTPB|nr:guanylate kinase [Butyrivibrio proteoclasticus]ADL34020.1 guanylate kinase Gmk2 [Butyrivibrio proteoclasticus B316]